MQLFSLKLLRCLAFFLAPLVLSAAAQAGQCLKDSKQISLRGVETESAVRINEYLCRSNSGNFEGLKVEFHRLNSLTASMVLTGRLVPQMEAIFGNAQVRQNSIYKQYIDLIEKFGVPFDRGWGAIELSVGERAGGHESSPEPVTVKSDEGGPTGNQELAEKYNGVRYLDSEFGLDIPLPKVAQEFVVTDKWPRGFNFEYPKWDDVSEISSESVIAETSIWRYLRPDTLTDMVENWKKLNNAVGADNGPTDETMKTEQFLRYVTRENFPEDFMVVTGSTPSGCEGGEVALSFSSKPRDVYVELAVIRNTSGQRITLDNLLGAMAGKPLLRSVDTLKGLMAAQAQAIGGVQELEANQAVIVPLKIVFVDKNNGPTAERSANSLAKQKAYRKALRKLGQKVFSGNIVLESFKPDGEYQERTVKVTKTLESFKKPKLAYTDDYVYGAAAHLAGFTVAGERVLLEDTKTNFVEFTSGSLEGSCPYLYAWNDQSQRWNNYGKVIHGYYGRQKEATERVKLHRFSTRFRLTEHELELSHINRVRLLVDLKDGRRLYLEPDTKSVQGKDASYQRIFAGASFEFNFNLPTSVNRDEVVRSHLDVTGYYRLYGSTFSSADQ